MAGAVAVSRCACELSAPSKWMQCSVSGGRPSHFLPPHTKGTRIIYDRKFLLERRSSPVTKTPPRGLPNIPGVTSPTTKDPKNRELLNNNVASPESSNTGMFTRQDTHHRVTSVLLSCESTIRSYNASKITWEIKVVCVVSHYWAFSTYTIYMLAQPSGAIRGSVTCPTTLWHTDWRNWESNYRILVNGRPTICHMFLSFFLRWRRAVWNGHLGGMSMKMSD